MIAVIVEEAAYKEAGNYSEMDMAAVAWKRKPVIINASIRCQSRLTCAPAGRRPLQMVARFNWCRSLNTGDSDIFHPNGCALG
jgi:hypothetical protein